MSQASSCSTSATFAASIRWPADCLGQAPLGPSHDPSWARGRAMRRKRAQRLPMPGLCWADTGDSRPVNPAPCAQPRSVSGAQTAAGGLAGPSAAAGGCIALPGAAWSSPSLPTRQGEWEAPEPNARGTFCAPGPAPRTLRLAAHPLLPSPRRGFQARGEFAFFQVSRRLLSVTPDFTPLGVPRDPHTPPEPLGSGQLCPAPAARAQWTPQRTSSQRLRTRCRGKMHGWTEKRNQLPSNKPAKPSGAGWERSSISVTRRPSPRSLGQRAPCRGTAE